MILNCREYLKITIEEGLTTHTHTQNKYFILLILSPSAKAISVWIINELINEHNI